MKSTLLFTEKGCTTAKSKSIRASFRLSIVTLLWVWPDDFVYVKATLFLAKQQGKNPLVSRIQLWQDSTLMSPRANSKAWGDCPQYIGFGHRPSTVTLILGLRKGLYGGQQTLLLHCFSVVLLNQSRIRKTAVKSDTVPKHRRRDQTPIPPLHAPTKAPDDNRGWQSRTLPDDLWLHSMTHYGWHCCHVDQRLPQWQCGPIMFLALLVLSAGSNPLIIYKK